MGQKCRDISKVNERKLLSTEMGEVLVYHGSNVHVRVGVHVDKDIREEIGVDKSSGLGMLIK